MCAIIGALLHKLDQPRHTSRTLNFIIRESHERGRDGRGFLIIGDDGIEFESRDTHRYNGNWPETSFPLGGGKVLIGNLRAEPTTEYVEHKVGADQQPYTCGKWSIVHNGTVANDKELRTHARPTKVDSAAIAEILDASTFDDPTMAFVECVNKIKGSYAILAAHVECPGNLWVATNYKPIWYAEGEDGVFFASARHYFPHPLIPQMLRPYTVGVFSRDGLEVLESLGPFNQNRALVVCSGGLDSVVAATCLKGQGYNIALAHFRYGSRAEAKEIHAIEAVAKALDVPYTIIPLPIYKPGDSPLLRADSTIAGGEAGAEFAHEWVPARNLVMLSVATAYAEANGFDTIALGNNLEEAGAYPDNEPEFIARFADLLPFAVGDGKRVGIIQPVGNLMKHEIVALGHEVGAPMHLTWSCYRAGPVHCGTCGPCYMRRKAFEINKLPEVIPYANG